GGAGLEVDVVRPFFNDPGFVAANTAAVVRAVEELPADNGVHVAYVTHSIPETMQEASAVTGPGYREQHEDVRSVVDAELRERGLEVTSSSLSYCSRSGDPRDRKSTRLNSSHVKISYAVFCLK